MVYYIEGSSGVFEMARNVEPSGVIGRGTCEEDGLVIWETLVSPLRIPE